MGGGGCCRNTGDGGSPDTVAAVASGGAVAARAAAAVGVGTAAVARAAGDLARLFRAGFLAAAASLSAFARSRVSRFRIVDRLFDALKFRV